MRARLRRIPVPLAILLAVAALHGVAWSIATAPLQGPDEIAHTAYAMQMAATGDGPDKDSGSGSVSTAMNVLMTEINLSPILGHSEGRPFWERAGIVAKHADELGTGTKDNASGPNSAGNYPPGYYVYAAAAYKLSPDRDLLGRFYAMRVANVALFVLTVGLAWLLFAELFVTPWKRTFATALVALQPKLGFMSGVINPDVMITAIGTWTLLVAIRAVRLGPTWQRALGLGVLAALAALTHPRGLFLPPFAVLAFLLAIVRHRAPLPRVALGTGLAAIPAAVGAYLAVSYTRSHAGGVAFGSGSPVASFSPRQFVSYVWQFYLPKLNVMAPRLGPDYGYRQVYIESFFGTFANLEVNFPPYAYDVLRVGAVLGLLGIYTVAIFRWRVLLARWAEIVVFAGYFVGLMALLHIVSYGALRGGTDPVITGRYLLPAVTIYAATATFVIGSLPRRIAPYVAGAVLAGSTLLCLGGVAISWERFYG
jgi:4-amino-4-deoxy-L-arabinose transferase-like glycosyltransferase